MQAVTGSFGPAKQTTETDTRAREEPPWLYVLSVLQSKGSFATMAPIASAVVKTELESFFLRWKSITKYAGPTRIDKVAFVGDV